MQYCDAVQFLIRESKLLADVAPPAPLPPLFCRGNVKRIWRGSFWMRPDCRSCICSTPLPRQHTHAHTHTHPHKAHGLLAQNSTHLQMSLPLAKKSSACCLPSPTGRPKKVNRLPSAIKSGQKLLMRLDFFSTHLSIKLISTRISISWYSSFSVRPNLRRNQLRCLKLQYGKISLKK